jgi:sortase A
MGCDPRLNYRERKPAYGGSQIARISHIAFNVMSLLLVGVGIALTATFFVGSLFAEQEHAARATAVDPREPEIPAITPSSRQSDGGKREAQKKEKREIASVPKDKTLWVTVPKMNRVRKAAIPYAGGTDENAFRSHVGVHLRGTGFPWQRQANVFIAGHRLGYVGTPSWLSFWDLNEVDVGDKIFVTDSTGRRYVYQVFKDFIVDPTEVSVTRPLKGRNILTLQTCTLPNYSRRLIIHAERVRQPVSFDTQEEARR